MPAASPTVREAGRASGGGAVRADEGAVRRGSGAAPSPATAPVSASIPRGVRLTTADPDAAAAVVELVRASGLSTAQDAFVAFALASPAMRTWLAWQGERPVGTALALALGETGWIANVAVLPEARGRGTGGALTEAALAWLVAAGARGVHLLATELGQPVYERLGFAAEGGVYDKYTVPMGLAPFAGEQPAVGRGALKTALAIDAAATGERRAALIAPFAARVRATHDRDAGYALALPWGGGPIVALDDATARALWWRLYGSHAGLRWTVPAGNRAARLLARSYDLRPTGQSVRMRYGVGAALAPVRLERIWATWSGGFG
jgi:GNAT superfamily N-acetyltransferase